MSETFSQSMLVPFAAVISIVLAAFLFHEIFDVTSYVKSEVVLDSASTLRAMGMYLSTIDEGYASYSIAFGGIANIDVELDEEKDLTVIWDGHKRVKTIYTYDFIETVPNKIEDASAFCMRKTRDNKLTIEKGLCS